MGAPSFTPCETDFEIARCGIKIQAEAHGLDMTDPKIQAFLEHQVKVIADHLACERWQQNIIHDMTGKVKRDD